MTTLGRAVGGASSSFLVRRIEVRRVRDELGGARVDGLEGGQNTDLAPAGADGRFRGTGELGDAPVGEPELLGPPQHVRVGQRRLR